MANRVTQIWFFAFLVFIWNIDKNFRPSLKISENFHHFTQKCRYFLADCSEFSKKKMTLKNQDPNSGFIHVFASKIRFWKNFGLFTRSLFWARNGDFVIKVQFRHFREDIEFNVRNFRWIHSFYDENIVGFYGLNVSAKNSSIFRIFKNFHFQTWPML